MDRWVAIIIDLIILRLLAQVLPFTILYHQILPDDFKNAVFETLSRGEKYLLAPAYFVGLRAWWNGQTLGKRALGLRCVVTDTIMATPERAAALAEVVLGAGR